MEDFIELKGKTYPDITVHSIDEEKEIAFNTGDFCIWLTIDEIKELIEFLQE